MFELDLDLLIPPKLMPLYDETYDYLIAYGGRGGAKSWIVADRLLIAGILQPELILCTRETQKAIKDSVHKTLKDFIYQDRICRDGTVINFSDYYEVLRDSIRSKVNGTEFLFYGLKQNVSELKSIKGITKTWAEEAEKISADSWDILIPSIFRNAAGGEQLFISFNPNDENAPTYQRFIINTPPNSVKIHINYTDNPFCPPGLIREAEHCLKTDPAKYEYIWMGQPQKMSAATIFKDKFTVLDFEIVDNYGVETFNGGRIDYRYGLDFGFSVDPTAIIECFIQDGCLYITNEVYRHELDTDDIIPAIKEVMPKLVTHKRKVFADSARPETISQLSKVRNHREGYLLEALNIEAAIKGAGSIIEGINFLKNFKHIYVHSRCENMIYELRNYKYQQDKVTGEIFAKPEDKNNHLCDCLRYSLNLEIQATRRSIKISDSMVSQFL